MTREVESNIALPVSRNIRVDGGTYSINEHIAYTPVWNKVIDIPVTSGYTGSWDVPTWAKAQTNYHPDVVYMAMFRAKALVADYYLFTSPYTDMQYVFIDTTEDWCYLWIPMRGEVWGRKLWNISSGDVDITRVVLIPCIPTVVGAGYDDLDTDSDEGDSVIGKISYTPIPEFVDVGSSKLYDFTNKTKGDRIYDESGIKDIGGLQGTGFVLENDIIKVELYLQTGFGFVNGFDIFHNRFGVWKRLTHVPLGGSADGTDFWSIEIIKNTPYITHLKIRKVDDTFDIILRRGDQHVEVDGLGVLGDMDIDVVAGSPNSLLEFAWNDDRVTDTLRAGVVSSGIYTTNRTEEFKLSHDAPVTNHWTFLWKEDTHAYVYLSTLFDRDSMSILTTITNKLIDEIQDAFTGGYPVELEDSKSLYFGSAMFPKKLRWEAEDGTLTGAASQADANAYGGLRVNLSTIGSKVEIDVTEWEGYFPDGEYVIAFRIWKENAGGDVDIKVENITTVQTLHDANYNVVQETFYGEEWIVIEDADFVFSGADHIRVTVTRTDTELNPLYMDAIVFIPTKKKSGSSQSVFFPEGEDGLATMTMKEVKQHPEADKRR